MPDGESAAREWLFQPCPPRRERLAAGHDFPRHRHSRGYVSLILSGGFEEAGDYGRRRVGPGDALLHGPFIAHSERIIRRTEILNFLLPYDLIPALQHGVLADPDLIVRQSERSPAEALSLFFQHVRPVQPIPLEWPDLLARAILADIGVQLQDWAFDHRLHPASLARGFSQLYGVSPARYRVEQRARFAWQRIVGTAEALSTIAYDLGYADQAHMGRDVKALTSATPSRWRRLRMFKTRIDESVVYTTWTDANSASPHSPQQD